MQYLLQMHLVRNSVSCLYSQSVCVHQRIVSIYSGLFGAPASLL